MPSRDQPFSDRASAFWGHHRLVVEKLARIAGQGQLGLQRSDPSVGGRQLVGFHTRDALDYSGVDQRLALPPKQGGLTNPAIDGYCATDSPERSRITICRRTEAGYIRGM